MRVTVNENMRRILFIVCLLAYFQHNIALSLWQTEEKFEQNSKEAEQINSKEEQERKVEQESQEREKSQKKRRVMREFKMLTRKVRLKKIFARFVMKN